MSRSRVDRLYMKDKLAVCRRRRNREDLMSPNRTWKIDFQHNTLSSGDKVRTLSIKDVYSREMLKNEVVISPTALHVVRELEWLRFEHGLPERIMIDRRPEFTSEVLGRWSNENHVALHFATPGRPTVRRETTNASLESCATAQVVLSDQPPNEPGKKADKSS